MHLIYRNKEKVCVCLCVGVEDIGTVLAERRDESQGEETCC